MKIFSYYVIDHEGKKQRGTLRATTNEEACAALQQKGFIVLYVKAEEKKEGYIRNIGTVSFTEKLIFLQQIYAMLQAGLPLHEAIEFLQEEVENPAFRHIIKKIHGDIREGKTFGDALQQFPRFLPPITINLIKAGEASGTLEIVLSKITTYMEKQNALRKKIWAALTYPIIVLTLAVLMAVGIFGFLMPRLLQIFSSLNVKLPPLTKGIITIYTMFEQYGLFILGGILLIIVSTIALMKYKNTRPIFHAAWLHSPIIKTLTKYKNLVQLTRSLSILLETDIPIAQALEITKKTIGNIYYQRAMEEAGKNIAAGKMITHSLAQYPNLFPPMLRQMIYVGEKSGNLANVCSHLEKIYEQELDLHLQKLTTVLEPLLLIAVSFGVALLAIAVILPIYQLPSLIRH